LSGQSRILLKVNNILFHPRCHAPERRKKGGVPNTGYILDNKTLTVRGDAAATYQGDLSAKNAALNFYIPTTMTNGGTLLTVTGSLQLKFEF
jgi:hypothetical protein